MSDNRKLSLISLTWPIFLENLFRMLLGNVNTLMLSRYSDSAVSAVGVSNQIISMALTVFSIISTGSAIIISQYLGAKRDADAARSAVAAVYINIAVGLIASVLVTTLSPQLLGLMNLPEESWGFAMQYLKIVGMIAAVQALTSTISAIIRSFGHTRWSLVTAVVMNLINITGNYMVIFRPFGLPSYGVAGIAYTRVLSEISGLVLVAAFMLVKLNIAPYFKFKFMPRREVFKKIIGVGAPAAAEGVSWTVSQTVIVGMIASLGGISLTTRIYVNNIVFYVYLLSMSMGSASQILAGRLTGSGRSGDVYHLCIRNVMIAMSANIGMSCVFMLLRFRLLGIFTNDRAIIELGAGIMLLDILVEGGRALNHIVPSCLRGAGDVRFPMLIIVASMWIIGVPLCWVMGNLTPYGLYGIWIALAIEEWTRGLLLLARLRSRKWEKASIV